MIQSAMQMEKVFFDNIYDLVHIRFSASEIQHLKDIQAALSPLHHLTKAICSNDADLLVADVAFKTALNHLKRKENDISQSLHDALRHEYSQRKNTKLVRVLRYLQNPEHLHDQETDPLFSMGDSRISERRKAIEKDIRTLLKNLFPTEVEQAEGTVEDVELEDTEIEDDENDFAADLKKNLAKELAGPKVVNDDLKFLTKEMGIFEGRKEKSDCLQKLYNALLNISPTSVSCERLFSIAGGLIP